MTNIKKRGGQAVRYITLVLTTVAIILTLLAISVLTGTDVKSNTVDSSINAGTLLDVPESKTVSVHESEQISSVSCYTITLSDGELRLISADDPGSYTVLDGIDPRTLRESDKAALEAGLQLDSEEALCSFLEDFSS